MIRLYVGTDPSQHMAEKALEASVRANTKAEVDITWCRQGDPDWDWGGMEAGWATPFTWFRWFVPKFCEFKGRAIYVDVDMLILGDLQELWDWPIPDYQIAVYAGRRRELADVIVWECDRLRDRELHYMKADALRAMAQLPSEWDHIDKLRDNTKILHFSKMSTQPWKPYLDRFTYDKPHPDPEAEALFWHYANMDT